VTAPGGDILAWTDHAISAHEAAATAAATAHGGRWVQGFPEQHKDPAMHYGWDADMVHLSQDNPHIAYQCLSDEIAALTVLHDPESVLRRCAADRKLLDLHQAVTDHGRYSGSQCPAECAGQHKGPLVCASCRDYAGDSVEAPCSTAVLIAEGYGWTEGER
jgi:hypothetical protein